MSSVFITDYVQNPSIEKEILGEHLTMKPLKKVKVLLVWHEQIDSGYLDEFPNLIGIVRYGVGIDSIDLREVEKRKLILCNTPDYGVDEVSDTAISMIMNFNRGISEYNRLAKNLRETWETNTINHLRRTKEQHLGVLGAGSIGSSLILKAKALGFRVSFFDPFKESGFEKALGVNRYYELDEIVKNSDILSINIPLNPDTEGLVDENFISKMKEGSTLINTSRGKILKNLDLLYEPLISGKLKNVGLDVLPEEPPQSGLLIDAWRNNDKKIINKVIINPHVSYFSQEAYKEMRQSAARNALNMINNHTPRNIILDSR
tara:strand:+ start:875 stop:1828 length:954 start_codon:yes stop_codon:yes gene_type:complete